MVTSGYFIASALLVAFATLATAEDSEVVGEDMYYWNSMAHPYQEYYLEDYCGPQNSTVCDSKGHTIYASSAGSSSGLVINGFRGSRPNFSESTRCCLTVKTLDLSRFNVQLDEVALKQSDKPGEQCDNFVRINSLQEELDMICERVQTRSFRTRENQVSIEYFIDTNDAPQYQRIKLVVTATEDAAVLEGGQCNATREQWMCENGACIWEGFRCDGHNNCADWSDEFRCGFFWRYWPWLAALLGSVTAAISCTCCCCCCCRRKKPLATNVYTKMPTGLMEPSRNDYQFVSSLTPSKPPVMGKIYPSLDSAYQRGPGLLPPYSQTAIPPNYSESSRMAPKYNSEYGAIGK